MDKVGLSSHRILVFDILRIFLIICVLHVHIGLLVPSSKDFLTQFDYFAVPLFLLLSFYLSSKYFIQQSLSGTYLITRLKRLFFPFLFYSFLGFLVNLNLVSFSNIFIQILSGQVVNLPIYYLNILILFTFFCFVLTYIPLTLRIIIWFALIPIVFILQYSQINYHFFMPHSWFTFGRITELLPYALLGLIWGLYKNIEKSTQMNIIIFLLALICYYISLSIPAIEGFYYQGLSIFFGSIAIFSFFLLLQSKIGKKYKSHGINILGEYTFGVFLFHYILLEVLIRLFPVLNRILLYHPNIFLLFFLVICYSLCWILDRLTKKKLSFLFR